MTTRSDSGTDRRLTLVGWVMLVAGSLSILSAGWILAHADSHHFASCSTVTRRDAPTAQPRKSNPAPKNGTTTRDRTHEPRPAHHNAAHRSGRPHLQVMHRKTTCEPPALFGGFVLLLIIAGLGLALPAILRILPPALYSIFGATIDTRRVEDLQEIKRRRAKDALSLVEAFDEEEEDPTNA